MHRLTVTYQDLFLKGFTTREIQIADEIRRYLHCSVSQVGRRSPQGTKEGNVGAQHAREERRGESRRSHHFLQIQSYHLNGPEIATRIH
jgi:hypothetical protein